MPRPRYQEGCVREEGKRSKRWVGTFRVRQVGPAGTELIRGRKVHLGLKAAITKAEARKRLRAVIEREMHQGPRATDDVTFGWFALSRYLPMRERSLKPSSAKHLRWFVEAVLIPKWGAQPLSRLDRFSLQIWLHELADCGKSKSLVHKARTYMHAILDEALEQDLVAKNPARHLEMPRLADPKRRVLTQGDCARLSGALDGRDRLIFLLLVEAGLRPGELFALRWDDWELGTLRIDERVYRGTLEIPKTARSTASMMIPKRVDLLLQKYRHEAAGAADFIFPASRGGMPLDPKNWMERCFRPVARQLKLGWVNYQALRRTFATLIQRFGTIKDAQSLMRHASPVMTLGTYTQPLPASQRAAVEGLDKLIVRSRLQ